MLSTDPWAKNGQTTIVIDGFSERGAASARTHEPKGFVAVNGCSVADIQAKLGGGFDASKDRLITIYFETKVHFLSKENESDHMRDTTRVEEILADCQR